MKKERKEGREKRKKREKGNYTKRPGSLNSNPRAVQLLVLWSWAKDVISLELGF